MLELTDHEIAMGGLITGTIAMLAGIGALAVSLRQYLYAKRTAQAQGVFKSLVLECGIGEPDWLSRLIFVHNDQFGSELPIPINIRNTSDVAIEDVVVSIYFPTHLVEQESISKIQLRGEWANESNTELRTLVGREQTAVRMYSKRIPNVEQYRIHIPITFKTADKSFSPARFDEEIWSISIEWKYAGNSLKRKIYSISSYHGTVDSLVHQINDQNERVRAEIAAGSRRAGSLPWHAVRYIFLPKYRREFRSLERFAICWRTGPGRITVAEGIYEPSTESCWVPALGTTVFCDGRVMALESRAG